MSEQQLLTRGKPVLQLNGSASSAGRSFRVPPYDASTGEADAGNGTALLAGAEGGLRTVLADDAWKWLLAGLVARSD